MNSTMDTSTATDKFVVTDIEIDTNSAEDRFTDIATDTDTDTATETDMNKNYQGFGVRRVRPPQEQWSTPSGKVPK